MDVGEFRFGPWRVQPALNRLSSDRTVRHLRPRTMDVLVHLAAQAPLVVSREDLLQAVWPNQHIEDEGLTHCIAELRDAIGEPVSHGPRNDNPGPSESPHSLIETIPKRGYRLSAPVRWARAPTPASNHGCAVVVLPLDDLGPERDECFSQGLTEAMIAALAAIPGLRVVSRTSATHLERGLDLRGIAGKVSVSHAIEGGIRRAGGRTLLTLRLMDAQGDTQLWSRTFVEDGGDSLDLQERTACAVADAMVSVLGKTDAE